MAIKLRSSKSNKYMSDALEKGNGMKEKEALKKSGKGKIFVAITILVPLIAVAIIVSTYGMVKNYKASSYDDILHNENVLGRLFRGNYVLYKNLWEKMEGKSVQYTDIYLKDMKGFLGNSLGDYTEDEKEYYLRAFNSIFVRELEDNSFETLQYFDYYAEDLNSGVTISNAQGTLADNLDKYVYYLEIVYDENGSAAITSAKSENADQLMRRASELTLAKNQLLQDWITSHGYEGRSTTNLLEYGDGPKNCRIAYGMTQELLEAYYQGGMGTYRNIPLNVYYNYLDSGIMGYITLVFWGVLLLALFLPLRGLVGKPFHKNRILNIPIEAVLAAVIVVFLLSDDLFVYIIRFLTGQTAADIADFMQISLKSAGVFTFYTHMVPLYAIFMVAWYLGLCLRGAREKGILNYIKENCLFYRIFPFCKRRLVAMYDSLEHIDVTKKAGKTILKIVLINAVILFVISSLWFGGFAITICYSILLYFGLKFYVSRLQKRYSILLSKIQEISAGNLNVEIQEDLGLFEPFKEQLLLIQTGFRNAVEEEVKSQKMKSELITNVSHDLKTPLTAIITYVDLLKDDTLSREKQIEYLNTLERKSLRLKVLIEDLFEVSKATSGNVTLNYQNVDICNLIKQVELEMSDKIADAGLDVRMDFPEEKVFVVLDSQKTYRIYENLFSNIVKYSLRGTRVYVRGTLTDDYIVISLKNISAAEITVDTAELTERFVRGDASRNTEGSGLGLAIVKSFVELQGGRFMLENDGDLFKAVTSFPRKR